MLKRALMASCLMIMLAGTGVAEAALPPEPKNFSLELALATAMRHNPNIQAAEARLAQARLEKETQDLWWARTMRANVNYAPFGGNGFGGANITADGTILPTAVVGFGMNVGELLAGPKQSARAEQAVRIAEAELRRTTLEVAGQVTAAYQQYRIAKEMMSFSGDYIHAAETDVKLAERQFSHGLGQVNTLLGARLAVQRARADQLQTTGNAATSWTNLLSLMGTSDWLPAAQPGAVANGR